MATRKPTAKQLAARKKFAEAAKSGKFRKKKKAAKKRPAKKQSMKRKVVKKRAPSKKTTKKAPAKKKQSLYEMTWQWSSKGPKVEPIPISGVKEFKVWEKYLKAKGALKITRSKR